MVPGAGVMRRWASAGLLVASVAGSVVFPAPGIASEIPKAAVDGAVSAATPAVASDEQTLAPTDVSPPVIGPGNPYEPGSPYVAVAGTWTGDPTSFAYQWLDCTFGPTTFTDPPCTPIAGATAQWYAPTSSDIGFNIAVEEWATNPYGTGGPARSQITYAYTGPPPAAAPPPLTPPRLTGGPPVISGRTAVGGALTASTGSWTAGAPISYDYQWQRCRPTGCASIPAGTEAFYTLTGADVGDAIEVLVTATDSAGSNSQLSAAVGPITRPATRSTAPSTRISVSAQRRSLRAAVRPGKHATISRILHRDGYSSSINALPAGRLTASWSVSNRATSGRSVKIASADVVISGSSATRIHLRLTRRGRELLSSSRRTHARARATFKPRTGSRVWISESITLGS